MKPILIKNTSIDRQTIFFQRNREKFFKYPWHYHQEMELILVLEGKGTRLLGDSIEKFEAGDLVLIGKNTPHIWQNPKHYYEKDSTKNVEAIVLHFYEHFHGEKFAQLPETRFLTNLYAKARNGLKVYGKSHSDIKAILLNMQRESDFIKILSLLKIMEILHTRQEFRNLATDTFVRHYFEHKNERFNAAYNYLMENFNRKVRLAEVAEITHLSETAFCRFFKRHSGKSFSQFLKVIRIGYACQLLSEKDDTISNVAYLSGYENISNFNKHFKELKNTTPNAFKKHFSESR